MSRWRDQLTNVSSNAFDFVQRISNELVTETEIDATSEASYHKDNALKNETEVVRLRSELERRDQKIDELNSSVKEAYEEVEVTRTNLLRRIAAKDVELEKAKHEISALREFQPDFSETPEERNQNDLALELELIRAEKAALSEQLTKATERLQKFDGRESANDQVSEEVGRLRAENQQLSEQLAKKEERKNAEHVRTESSSRVNVEELHEIEAKVVALKDERDLLMQTAEDEKAARELAELNLSKLLTHCNDLGVEIERFLYVNKALLSSRDKTARQLEEFNIQNELLQNGLATSERNLAEFQDELVQLKRSNRELRERLDKRETELKNLDTSTDESDLAAQLRLREDQVHQLEEEINRLTQSLAETEQRANEQRAHSDSEAQRLLESRTAWEDEVKKLGDHVHDLQQQIIAEQSRSSGLSSQYEELQRRSGELPAEIADLRTQLEERDAHIAHLSNQLHEAASRSSKAEQESQDLIAVKEQVKQELSYHHSQEVSQFSDEIRRLQALLAELQKEKEAVDLQLGETNRSLNSLRAEHQSLREVAADAETYHQHTQEKMKKQQAELDELYIRNEELKQSVVASHQDLEEVRNQLSEANERLNEATERLQLKSDEIKALLSEKEALDQNAGQLFHLHQENQQLREQSMRLQDVLDEANKEKLNLVNQLTEARGSLTSLATEQKNWIEGTTEAEMYRLHTKTKIEKKQAELDEKMSLLDQRSNELQFYKSSSERLQEENSGLQKLVASLNETVRDLQGTYAELNNRQRAGQTNFEARIRTLEQENQRLEAERAAAESTRSDLEFRAKTLEAHVEELRAELDIVEERNINAVPPEPDFSNRAGITMTSSGFVVPPVVRQFIISAVTCDQTKRQESAMVLASVIGCTNEEKNQIAACFNNQPSGGWFSLLRPQAHKGPRDAHELYDQFMAFLERETAHPLPAAPAPTAENPEPVRIDHDIHLVDAPKTDPDLQDIVN